jgi:hypothetical protein
MVYSVVSFTPVVREDASVASFASVPAVALLSRGFKRFRFFDGALDRKEEPRYSGGWRWRERAPLIREEV